jgi:hypothetical protein
MKSSNNEVSERKNTLFGKLKLFIVLIVAGIILLLITAWVKDQNSIKAIYLVQGQGKLDQRELARHPEIIVTGSFEKFKGYAKQRVALWIDKNANTVDLDNWLRAGPQIFYPIVLVGYGDDNYSFENILGLDCLLNDPLLCASRENLNANKPDPGFSVLQLAPFNPPPGYLGFSFNPRIIFKQGYRYKPHVEDILNITNGLLDNIMLRLSSIKQSVGAWALPQGFSAAIQVIFVIGFAGSFGGLIVSSLAIIGHRMKSSKSTPRLNALLKWSVLSLILTIALYLVMQLVASLYAYL